MLLKSVKGDYKYLRKTDLLDKKFDVLLSDIALDQLYLVCEKTVKAKPTINDSVLITYSNTIYFVGIWLDNSCYIITEWQNL